MADYDAIIVGAGPAGGQCARELAQRGRSVLLLERAEFVGEPNFSTGGTPDSTMSDFEIPADVANCGWDSLLIASARERAEFVYGKRMGYVLDYKRLKQFLCKDAEERGAEVLTGAVVEDVVRDGSRIVGVTYRYGDDERKALGKVVVDATGGRCFLSRKVGLLDPDRLNLSVGIEHHMEGVELERPGRMEFYLGPSYVPGGYAWIFPLGDGRAKVGAISMVKSEGNRNLSALLDRFIESNPQTRNARKTNFHGGSLYWGSIKNHALDGFLTIGDAAAQINPLGAEGIRHALYSGRFAAKAIESALGSGDLSGRSLSAYNRMWKKYVGWAWPLSGSLSKFMYNPKMKDHSYDRFVRAAAKASPGRMFDVLFNYKFGVREILKGLLKSASV